MVKDSRNPGVCGVLLPPWVVPLWSLDGPERFLLFQICAFTVFFAKEAFHRSVTNGNEMIQLLKMYLIQYDTIVTQCISCNKIQCIYNSPYLLGS